MPCVTPHTNMIFSWSDRDYWKLHDVCQGITVTSAFIDLQLWDKTAWLSTPLLFISCQTSPSWNALAFLLATSTLPRSACQQCSPNISILLYMMTGLNLMWSHPTFQLKMLSATSCNFYGELQIQYRIESVDCTSYRIAGVFVCFLYVICSWEQIYNFYLQQKDILRKWRHSSRSTSLG